MLHKNSSGENAGLISNIQKYTIHDGPGIRTEIFFTGCPLKCIWCSNPETLSPNQQLGIYPSKCLSLAKCGHCLKVCPQYAQNATVSVPPESSYDKNASNADSNKTKTDTLPILHDENGVIKSINMQNECMNCLKCADACSSGAIKLWGEFMTVDELMKIILEDKSFYDKTGGGVTLSGGEVMMQWEFAKELLIACRNAGVNTCVETALQCSWAQAEALFEYTDLIITDIKHMDSEKHREITGTGNELILENIKKAANLGIKMVVRTPVVIGYNADDENIRRTGEFIKNELGDAVIQFQLLPYRKMGTEKYDSLGIEYPMGNYIPPERDEWEQNLLYLADMLKNEFGLPAVAGSNQKLPI